jgi:hypothetical protein
VDQRYQREESDNQAKKIIFQICEPIADSFLRILFCRPLPRTLS